MIKTKFSKFKSDVIEYIKVEQAGLVFILVAFLLLTALTWNKWGELMSFDNSKEFLVPYLMTKGQILYKDIFYVYGPLVPYYFASLFKIFGVHLGIFYFTGLILTFIYSFSFYYFARFFLDKTFSTIAGLLFLIQLAFFNTHAFSYIFPYTYGATLGTLLLLLTLIFLIKHYQTSNTNFIWLALMACAVNLLVKQDFFISSLAACGFYFFLYPLKLIDYNQEDSFKKAFKYYFRHFPIVNFIKSLLIIFIIPSVILTLVAIQTGVSNLIEGLFPFKLVNSPSFQLLMKELFNAKYSNENLFELIYYAFTSAAIILLFTTIVYFLIKVYKKIGANRFIMFLFVLLLLFLIPVYLINQNDNSVLTYVINSIPKLKFIYSGINLWLILLLIHFFLKLKDKPDIILILIISTALITNARMFFNLELELYAFYYLPISLVIFVYILSVFIPEHLNNHKSFSCESWKTASKIFLSLLIIIYSLLLSGVYSLKNTKVVNAFGVTYTKKNIYPMMIIARKAADFIKQNTSEHDRFIIYPHFNITYLLADRLPGSRNYYLDPSVISTKSDYQKLIREIKKQKPEYILIENELAFDSYYQKLLKNAGHCKETLQWVRDNFEMIKTFSAGSNSKGVYKIEVYKTGY